MNPSPQWTCEPPLGNACVSNRECDVCNDQICTAGEYSCVSPVSAILKIDGVQQAVFRRPGTDDLYPSGNPNAETNHPGIREERVFVTVPPGMHTISIHPPEPAIPSVPIMYPFEVDLIKVYR